MFALGAWGAQSPQLPRGEPMSVDSHMLALLTMFDGQAAGDFDASLQLIVDGHRFRARVAEGALDLRRGSFDDPDATVTTDSGTLAAVLWQGGSLKDAVRTGELAIDGSKEAVKHFLGLFPLPERAHALVEA
jgi:alkyl sulfatase BDS1-like metallo-beta-lactamase superfamily hydrolase